MINAVLTVRRSRIATSPARSPHIVYLLAPLLATTLVACGGSASSKKHAAATDTTAKGCRQVPPPAASNIAWVPADLPLPDRTYAVSDTGTSPTGLHHGVFATSVTIRDFVRFAVTQWPAKGWRLGRGESESNEAEDDFARGKESGSFKVRSESCDQSWSELNVYYKSGLP